jgi:hypothetical protein
MRLRLSLAASSAALGLIAVTAAHAAILFAGASPSAQMATDSSFNVSFNGGSGGMATLSFILDGFRSLDGRNTFEDDFSLSLNGAALIAGTFNLGGGGADVVFLEPAGATITNVSGNGTAITFTGGEVDIATPVTLASGLNTLTFGYTSLGGPDAGFQGMGDEAWGAQDIEVTTPEGRGVVGELPEPAAWALMMAGFGGAGAMLRSRRRLLAAVR